MTEGRLGMVVCPMLEDEAIYNLKNDHEDKRIYLVKGAYNTTIIPKLKQHNVPYTMIDEHTVLNGDYDHDGYTVIIWTMFMGVHEDIDMLRMEVMNQIVKIHSAVDTILLYYGRCGRGLDTICDWAYEMVPTPVCIFRNKDGTICDDCICIPVGGTERYLKLLRKYPGRFYFTPAMASNFEGFLMSMELFNGLDVKNDDIMKIILDLAGYTTVMRVQTGNGDQEHFDENIKRFTDKYNLECTRLEDGWATNDLADLNYDNAKSTMTRWLNEGKKERVIPNAE